MGGRLGLGLGCERGALTHPIATVADADVSLAPAPHLVIRPSPATGSQRRRVAMRVAG